MRDFIDNIFSNITDGALFSDPINFLLPYFTWASRLLLPAIAVIIVARCAVSLFRARQDKETWAWLALGDGVRLPVNHWENIIGRGTNADIALPFADVSRNHAALIRNDQGSWLLSDIAKKSNLLVNGILVEDSINIEEGDVIEISGNKLVFVNITAEEDEQQRQQRQVPGKKIRPSRTLAWLSAFIIIMACQMALARFHAGDSLEMLLGFLWLLALVWGAWLFSRSLRRTGFEIETLAFFLSSLGLAVVASASPNELIKYCLAITLGVVGFFVLGLIMRDLKLVKKLRWVAAALALALIGYVILFGDVRFGAQNWITIFGFSLQPSELVKVLFIFAGAASLDRLFTRRNLYAFIALSAAIVGGLALMSDFGTAIIFFVAYLIIAFLRSGSWATIGLSIGGAVSAVVLVLTIKPYVAERFAAWGHAWEYAATSGYQQTRSMSVISSGGMFGMGGGEGWLKWIPASDTDLVFAFISEEWGLIIGFLALISLVLMALFALRCAGNARSSYYIIAACGTAALLLFQTFLNVGGTLDLLPLTGVTFPFVSKGGTSMIACWCMMAFLKAVDTRQNASFAISLPSRRKMRKQEAANQPLLPLEQIFDSPPANQEAGETASTPQIDAADIADSDELPQAEPIAAKPADFSFPPLNIDEAMATLAASSAKEEDIRLQAEKLMRKEAAEQALLAKEKNAQRIVQDMRSHSLSRPKSEPNEEISPFANPFPSIPRPKEPDAAEIKKEVKPPHEQG